VWNLLLLTASQPTNLLTGMSVFFVHVLVKSTMAAYSAPIRPPVPIQFGH